MCFAKAKTRDSKTFFLFFFKLYFIVKAKKLRDYLKKKSPRIIKGFQKRFLSIYIAFHFKIPKYFYFHRYFIIADNGSQLVWFKNEVITIFKSFYFNLLKN